MNLPLPDDLTEEELHVDLIPVECDFYQWLAMRSAGGEVADENDDWARCMRCQRNAWWPFGLVRFEANCPCWMLCNWCGTVDEKAHRLEHNDPHRPIHLTALAC